MKKLIETIAMSAFVLVAAAALLTGCSEDEERDYIYTLGIEDYSYSAVGSGVSLLGPMGYLSELAIADRIVVTAEKAGDADAEARTRFDAEMARIDRSRLDSYGKYYFRYVLYSVEAGRTIAEKEFGTR